jgi:hypothetical protein
MREAGSMAAVSAEMVDLIDAESEHQARVVEHLRREEQLIANAARDRQRRDQD